MTEYRQVFSTRSEAEYVKSTKDKPNDWVILPVRNRGRYGFKLIRVKHKKYHIRNK